MNYSEFKLLVVSIFGQVVSPSTEAVAAFYQEANRHGKGPAGSNTGCRHEQHTLALVPPSVRMQTGCRFQDSLSKATGGGQVEEEEE